MNNLKQLTLAAMLYANDNKDAIVPNGISQSVTDSNRVWIIGNVAALPDATNILFIQVGRLSAYRKERPAGSLFKKPRQPQVLSSPVSW